MGRDPQVDPRTSRPKGRHPRQKPAKRKGRVHAEIENLHLPRRVQATKRARHRIKALKQQPAFIGWQKPLRVTREQRYAQQVLEP